MPCADQARYRPLPSSDAQLQRHTHALQIPRPVKGLIAAAQLHAADACALNRARVACAVQAQKKAEKAKRKFDAEIEREEAGLSKAPRRVLTAEERAEAEQCVPVSETQWPAKCSQQRASKLLGGCVPALLAPVRRRSVC